MGPIWGRQDPGGPYVGPMNLAIWVDTAQDVLADTCYDHVIWRPRRGWTEWNQNLCTVVMTYNDLYSCIALTKWDGPVSCVNVTENVENSQSKCYRITATKTSETVSVKQHDRATRCTLSIDSKEIKTILQLMPSTCAICLQTQLWVTEDRLKRLGYLKPRIFEYALHIFFPKCIAYQTGTYEMTHKSVQS